MNMEQVKRSTLRAIYIYIEAPNLNGVGFNYINVGGRQATRYTHLSAALHMIHGHFQIISSITCFGKSRAQLI